MAIFFLPDANHFNAPLMHLCNLKMYY